MVKSIIRLTIGLIRGRKFNSEKVLLVLVYEIRQMLKGTVWKIFLGFLISCLKFMS